MSSVPGKIFLLGEYAVLHGGPAWVAAVGPRFTGSVALGSLPMPFAAESPAGRYASAAGAFDFKFSDPHGGRGGFGASTAQFALAYAGVEKLAGRSVVVGDAWRAYREVAGGASGADLVAQLAGGVQRVVIRGGALEHKDIGARLLKLHWVVLSAAGMPGRKVATHQHLASLPAAMDCSALTACVLEAEESLAEGDVGAVGGALTRYARLLSGLGLELPAAAEDRAVLSRVRGVLGYKGCGALLADAAVALVVDERAAEKLIAAATERGLKVVADGLVAERGYIA